LLTLEDGSDKLSETSVNNYQSTLRNVPEELSSLGYRMVTEQSV